VDRRPFRNLLTSRHLCDATATGSVEYTIERSRGDVISRFRCDLALVTDYVRRSVDVRYEHSSRLSEACFSDHSAIILDVPVDPRVAAESSEWLFPDLAREIEENVHVCSPHKTAMARSEQSPVAVAVVERLLPVLRATSILDYGCGRGADVAYYRARGVPSVAGYDPYQGFGFASEPTGTFDIVTVVFVLNVLPDPWVRLKVLRSAANYLAPDGVLLVVTRSAGEIENRARIGGWDRHNDGYWSSRAKGTFQRGLDRQDILDLARRAGLQEHEHSGGLRFDQATTHLLLRRTG
jgi:SAM-dependent methyltransferase